MIAFMGRPIAGSFGAVHVLDRVGPFLSGHMLKKETGGATPGFPA
jgi:hypothetical protein